MPELQELIALGLVALVVAGYVWYRRRRQGGCADCAPPASGKREVTLRFRPPRQPGDGKKETPP